MQVRRLRRYLKRKVVICHEPETDQVAAQVIQDLWQWAGAEPYFMRAPEHDDVFAAVSHLPHLLAFALVDMLAAAPRADDYFNYAASGFRDFTRIAGGSPEMWRDISLNNRKALREQLGAYRAKLTELDALLAEADDQASKQVEACFERASRARHAWQRHIEYGEPLPKFTALISNK